MRGQMRSNWAKMITSAITLKEIFGRNFECPFNNWARRTEKHSDEFHFRWWNVTLSNQEV